MWINDFFTSKRKMINKTSSQKFTEVKWILKKFTICRRIHQVFVNFHQSHSSTLHIIVQRSQIQGHIILNWFFYVTLHEFLLRTQLFEKCMTMFQATESFLIFKTIITESPINVTKFPRNLSLNMLTRPSGLPSFSKQTCLISFFTIYKLRRSEFRFC